MLGSLFVKHYSFRYNKRNRTNAPELLRYVHIFQFVCFFSRRIRSTFQPKLLIVLLYVLLLIVFFYVLFVCKYVLYYCHRVST